MKKILIVEDDLFLSELYGKVFSKEGFDVKIAKDGVDGLEKLKDYKPEIILLDIMMPRMNGFEFLEKIKSQTEMKDIPVFVLSNITDPLEVQMATSKGALKYLVKSQYVPKQIVQIVTDYFKDLSSIQ